MPETLRLLVGDDFKVPCGAIGEPPCNEEDMQDILEYITEELGIDPRYEVEEPEGKWFTLADMLKALLLRIEALEE